MTNLPSIAVIGCGYWGANHARTLSELGALGAICDKDIKTAEKLAKTYDVPCLNFNDVLADKKISGLILALPPHLHCEHAVKAFNAGKHVLVEKPISLNTSDAERVTAAADKAGTIAMTSHILRYHPAFETMLEHAQSGELGDIKYLHSHRLGLGKFHPENDALWDIAPHDLSLIMAITGSAPSNIRGEGAATLNHLNDFAHLHLEFPNEIKAHVLVSRLNPYRERRLTVVGSEAMMSFDDALPWEQKLAIYKHKVWSDEYGYQSEMVDPEFIPIEQDMPLTKEIEDFLSCIQTGKNPRVTIKDGFEVVKILEAGSVHN